LLAVGLSPAASGTTQSWSRSPPSPSGFSSLWFGPRDEAVQRDRDMTPKLAYRASSVGGRLARTAHPRP
jgi:hypothetical protein